MLIVNLPEILTAFSAILPERRGLSPPRPAPTGNFDGAISASKRDFMAVMANYTASEPHKVLLVDDDETLLELFSSILQHAGYVVDTAHCGIEGIRKYRRDAAEVIIADRAMPQMDGEQMTEVIKALNPEVPVILITGLPGSLRHPDMFNAVLPKPFRSADLLALVETALSTHTRAAN